MLALLGKIRQQWRVAGKVNKKECCRREMSRSRNSDLRLRGAGRNIFGSKTLPVNTGRLRERERERQLADGGGGGGGRSQIIGRRESLVLIIQYSATKREKAWGSRVGKKMAKLSNKIIQKNGRRIHCSSSEVIRIGRKTGRIVSNFNPLVTGIPFFQVTQLSISENEDLLIAVP
jgi:hypothetical protein